MITYATLALIAFVVIVVSSTWSSVKKHAAARRAEVDLKQVEAAFPQPAREDPSPQQQALTTLLNRRRDLEDKINKLREQATYLRTEYGQDIAKQHRSDALKALEDARQEQKELVQELAKLLATMEDKDDARVDAPKEPVRVVAGGPVAQRVADPDLVHDAEPDEPEAGREGTA